MNHIKERRLSRELRSHPGLFVGECVPFYFCPRSVMLYLIHRRNHADLKYQGGQGPIVHLVADLHDVINWAQGQNVRWAITSSNAGARYFDDWADLDDLSKINWQAVDASDWSDPELKEGKQAEFLLEASLPWELVE